MRKITGIELQKFLERLFDGTDPAEVQEIIDSFQGKTEFLFEDVDWPALRAISISGALNFPRLNWGYNSLVFKKCFFGNGDITIAGIFHGPVCFNSACFGEGRVSFASSEFNGLHFDYVTARGEGEISFEGAKFFEVTRLTFGDLGSKSLNFGAYRNDDSNEKNPTLIAGSEFSLMISGTIGRLVSFMYSKFTATTTTFDLGGAEGLEAVLFSHSQWESEYVCLNGIYMNAEREQYLSFEAASFEKVGKLVLDEIGMEFGEMVFSFAHFPTKGVFYITFSKLGPGTVSFAQCLFPSTVDIRQLSGEKFGCELSLRGATIDGSLSIDGMNFGPVPDLIGTVFRKHLNLSNITFGVEMSRSEKRAEKDRDAKLQRIKALAESNKDHGLALTCHAEEMRSKRFRKRGLGQFSADTLELLYEWASDYGRSIALPMFWLAVLWAGFGTLYRFLFDTIDSPLLFSCAWTFPFLPAAGVLRNNFESVFDQAGTPLYLLTGVQGVISFALLFLVGLGFRNRFRI